MPYICLRRTDIPDGALQVTDLWPSKSQFNPSQGPQPQGPRYVRAPVTSTVVLTSTGGDQLQFAQATEGLAAYLMANVEAGGAAGALALTPTQANTAAAALIAAMRAGSPLTLSDINTILVAAAGAATELTDAGGSASTGAVTDILSILAGAHYTVAAGIEVQTGAPDFNPQAGAAAWNAANFDTTKFTNVNPMDGSFYISLLQGQIKGFVSSSFTYKGSAGAALVAYDGTGAVL